MNIKENIINNVMDMMSVRFDNDSLIFIKNVLTLCLQKVGERSNVQNVHLHRFRHWFGTYMANRGVLLQDLKEMMGHSKIETTNKYYVFNNQERIKFNYKNNAA